MSAGNAKGIHIRLHIAPPADHSYERLGWQALEPAFYEGQGVTIMVIEPNLTRRR